MRNKIIVTLWVLACALTHPSLTTQGATPEGATSNTNRHWAFQPLSHPKVPKPGGTRIRNAIDAFVADPLRQQGLALSPEADKTTLLRRLSLDLTGLPPTLEELQAFESNRSTDAYEHEVDRLLRSPHYGEKWAKHWLDAARYADSNGFEKDRTRTIWPYRDYVIQAFNADLPFDQFTLEQLAGDLLNNPTRSQRIATGFLRNSMINMEGGIEPEKFRVETIIDRVDAVGRTWLGLTIACAQCHDHKYDPIRMTDYYGFYGLLNQDDEPKLDVPNTSQQKAREAIENRVKAYESEWMRSTTNGSELQSAWERRFAEPVGHWQVLDAKEWHSQPLKFEKQENLSLLGGGDIYNNSVLRIWVETTVTNITGFRLEALNNANLPFNGPGVDADGGFQLCEFTVEATPLATSKSTTLTATNTATSTNLIHFRRAIADAEAPGWPAMAAIDGNTTQGGWASAFTFGRRNEERRIVLETEKPAGFPGGTRMLISLHCKPKESQLANFMLGCVRVSLTTDATPLQVDPLSEKQRQLLSIPQEKRTDSQRRELTHIFRTHDASFASTWQPWDDLWKDWPKAEATTMVLQARPTPRVTHLFKRGDWQRPMEAISPDVPLVFPRMAPDQPHNRLGLARWIVDPQNPLTARVVVNRVWQHYFGQGLVPTVEDLGKRAELPSHPELLDWLAGEFIQRGWRMKELHRLIVSSATYRQSSRITPELLHRDPYNKWLARGARIRVDAETVNDIALAASGLLQRKIGGPSVFPPLPEGVMQLSYGPIPWNVSEGEDRYRRAIYTFWKRSVPYPLLTTFDAPTAEQSCVRRIRSNTPLQALVTLNEPTFQQAARWLAWRTLRDGGITDAMRLDHAFQLCVSRRPDSQERAVLMKLLESSLAEFSGAKQDAITVAFFDPKNPAPMPPNTTVADLAAWTTVSRALLNLDETITKE